MPLQFLLLLTSWSVGGVLSLNETVVREFIDVCLVRRAWSPAERDFEALTYDEVYGALRNTDYFDCDSRPLAKVEELFLNSEYDSRKETIVVVHTVSEGVEGIFTVPTVTALSLKKVNAGYNLFTVDMPELVSRTWKAIGMAALGVDSLLKVFGRAVASFLETGIHLKVLKPSQINLIGFCFSGQLVGYVARYLGGVNSVVALDPYRYGLGMFGVTSVSKKDARLVHIFHSASFFQGSFSRAGTVDVVFNSGNIQPGCLREMPWNFCSHAKALWYFFHVILYPETFVGRRCSRYLMFKLCLCEHNPTMVVRYPVQETAAGKYYVATATHHPYGLGEKGSRCSFKHSPFKLFKRKS